MSRALGRNPQEGRVLAREAAARRARARIVAVPVAVPGEDPRDYNGVRGPVPTGYTSWPLMDWQEAAGMRPVVERVRALAARDRRPPTGRGRFARGTFRVRL